MIAPQQQIALLQGLLECYSPTLAEEAAVGFLARWMEERGFQSR
jgi:acetylornithine deacetylase/succinyl-diaminopimelate desuccinylase-like protein